MYIHIFLNEDYIFTLRVVFMYVKKWKQKKIYDIDYENTIQ